MWNTSFCSLWRILRAVRSCKVSCTKKGCVMWYSHVLRCDLSLSGLSGSLSLELSLWHPAASFLTVQLLRRQYEVVSLGFVLPCGQCLPTVAAKKKEPTQQVQRWAALFKRLRKIHHQCTWPNCAARASSKELHLQHGLLMQYPQFLQALLRQHPAKSGAVFAVLSQRRSGPCQPSYRRGQLINWPQNVLSVFSGCETHLKSVVVMMTHNLVSNMLCCFSSNAHQHKTFQPRLHNVRQRRVPSR